MFEIYSDSGQLLAEAATLAAARLGALTILLEDGQEVVHIRGRDSRIREFRLSRYDLSTPELGQRIADVVGIMAKAATLAAKEAEISHEEGSDYPLTNRDELDDVLGEASQLIQRCRRAAGLSAESARLSRLRNHASSLYVGDGVYARHFADGYEVGNRLALAGISPLEQGWQKEGRVRHIPRGSHGSVWNKGVLRGYHATLEAGPDGIHRPLENMA
jgi:hypothetical protein